MPMTQVRRVHTGMLGSSVFATADLTSGYGESSSADSRLDVSKIRIMKTNDMPSSWDWVSRLGSSSTWTASAPCAVKYR